MKKIINGKVYNTETAKKCGNWDNGHYTNDFAYCSETLYQKKTGEFFLHGEGHAMSKYATHFGNNSGWGEVIIPMSYDEASKWSAEHLSGDEYISIFGEVSEDEEEGKTALHLYLDSKLIAKVKQESNKLGVSVSEYIANLLR